MGGGIGGSRGIDGTSNKGARGEGSVSSRRPVDTGSHGKGTVEGCRAIGTDGLIATRIKSRGIGDGDGNRGRDGLTQSVIGGSEGQCLGMSGNVCRRQDVSSVESRSVGI